jgi:hypothetical protein
LDVATLSAIAALLPALQAAQGKAVATVQAQPEAVTVPAFQINGKALALASEYHETGTRKGTFRRAVGSAVVNGWTLHVKAYRNAKAK